MSEPPNPKMEEILKAYGRKRQAEAGSSFEMHPATRKLLQDEVKRTFPQFGKRHPARLWTLLWPRLAFGGALFGILMWVVVLAEKKTSSKNITLSKNLPARRDEALDRRPGAEAYSGIAVSLDALQPSAPAEQTLATPTVSKANNQPKAPAPELKSKVEEKLQRNYRYGEESREKLDSYKEADLRKKKEVSNSSTILREIAAASSKQTSANKPAVAGAGEGKSAADKLSNLPRSEVEVQKSAENPVTARYALSLPGEAKAAKPAVTALQIDTLAMSKTKADNLGFTSPSPPASASSPTLHFVRAESALRYRRNLLSPPMPNVLSSFQFDRFGETVRLTDTDGSIYEGAINLSEQRGAPILAQRQTGLPDLNEPGARKDFSARAVDPTKALTFQVSGTNRTLNQLVTFQGSVAPTIADTILKRDVARSKSPAEIARNETAAPKRLGQLTPAPEKNSSNAAAPAAMRIQGRVSIGGTDEFEVRANSRR